MVVFAVHFDQVRFKTSADLAEDGAKPLHRIPVEYFAAVFRHKDQMNVHLENAMPAVSNLVVFFHSPSILNYHLLKQVG